MENTGRTNNRLIHCSLCSTGKMLAWLGAKRCTCCGLPSNSNHGYSLQMLKQTWPIIFVFQSVALLTHVHVLAYVRLQIKPDLLNTKFPNALYNLLPILVIFLFAAPQFWNSLPTHLHSATSLQMFKKGLKYHLFTQWYLLFRVHCFPFLNFFV